MYVMLNEIANVEDSVKFALVTEIQVYVVREYNRSENNVSTVSSTFWTKFVTV